MSTAIAVVNLILIPVLSVYTWYKRKDKQVEWDFQLLMSLCIAISFNVVGARLLATGMGRFIHQQIEPDSFIYTLPAFLSAIILPFLGEIVMGRYDKDGGETVRSDVIGAIDLVVLVAIAFTSFYQQLSLTTFYFGDDHHILPTLMKVLPLLILIKSILIIKDKMLWLSIPAAIVFYYAFPQEHYYYQAFYWMFIIGCVGIKVRKIIIAAGVPAALVIVNMMLASLSGAINSMATYNRNIRSYWGHISPTDFASAVIFIIIFAWLIFKDLPEEYFILPSFFSLYISFHIAHGFTGGLITVLFMAVLVIGAFELRYIEKKNKLTWITKVLDFCMKWAFPVFGAITLIGVFIYYKEIPIANTLNSLFHQRLLAPAKMLEQYGIKPFGTYFDMIGNGGSTISINTDYTFIDSSYPQILIRYGWVTYIVANILWVYTTSRAIKSGNRRMAFAMTLLAVNFVMEHHWYEICYNIFVILPFADFGLMGLKEPAVVSRFKERWHDKKYRYAFVTTAILLMAVIFLTLPYFFSIQKTVFQGYGLTGGGEAGRKLFVILTVIVVTMILFIFSLCSMAASYYVDRHVIRENIALLGTSAIVIAGFLFLGNYLVNKYSMGFLDRVCEDAELVEIVTKNASGKVYADKYPEVYIRTLDCISRSYYSGEDLSRSDNATVIVEADNDYQCFSPRGYLYLQISDADAIYTNDQAVIQALKDAGQILRGYNCYEYKVNMDYIAELNGLERTDDGGVVLEGPEKQLNLGPYVNVYGGKYIVKYKLRIESLPYTDDYKLCTLLVTSYLGSKDVVMVPVMRSDFDEIGELHFERRLSLYGQNFEFKVFMESGERCEVKEITYTRNPDYDIHAQIDNKGRQTRVEYYDLEGNPREMPGGYYGLEYAYDKRNLVMMQRYLGSDMEPAMLSQGYCELRNVYNGSKQLIRRAYYDTEGERVLLPEGYSMTEMDYDFSGNMIENRYFGLEDEKVLNNDAYWRMTRIYDDKHQCIHEEYYDIDNTLKLQNAGYAVMDREFDDNGNITDQIYLDDTLKPVVITSGYAHLKREYDDNNRIIREAYFDENDRPIALEGGQASVKKTYDDAGNVNMEEYYDVDGNPVLVNEKYFRYTRVYDIKNQVVQEKYFGTDGKPILINGSYAGSDRSFDDAGNIIHFTYLGIDGNPTMIGSGYSIWHRQYNDKRQVVRTEYYDVNDEKILMPQGYFAEENTYDDVGNCNSDSYFGLEGERVLLNGIYWKTARTYNENRKNIHEEYFGTDGNPILVSGTYSAVDFTYDENNTLAKKTFRDSQGNIVEEQVVE